MQAKKLFLLILLPIFYQTEACGQHVVNLYEQEDSPLSLSEMQTWQVVVGAEAIPGEIYAAEEFCRLFRGVTGTELKIVASAESKHAIYIGESLALPVSLRNNEVKSLGEEGLRIRITPNALAITGGRPRGTLYGVYEFFERYVGVRFLTNDDTYIPPGAAGTAIPLANYQYVPPFSFRWSFYRENFDDPAFAARLRVNTITKEERLGGKTAQELINHSISTYLPVSKYGKTHPEYFALVNGVRKLDIAGSATHISSPQVCSSNPDVIRIITEAVERTLDSNPSMKSISVSQMDNDFFCECPLCNALSVKEGSLGAPHLTLVNAVAEKIAKTHPGVKIGTLVYWYTRKPPKTIKLQPNVQIMLCSIECCTVHPLDDPDCSRNRVFCEDFFKWRSICKHIMIWNYNTNFSAYDLPFPNLNVIAKNVQFFRNNHVLGVFMQAAGNGLSSEMSDLRNYVMSRCLWHPEEESWKLVNEFCRLHYGASAPPILAYLRFLHHNAEVRGVHPNCFPKPVEVGLDLNVSQRIYAYFQEALKLAPDDNTIRLRVEKAMIPALRALLVTTPMVYDNGRYRLDTSVSTGILDQYIILTRKFGMNRIAEIRTSALYIEELQNLRKGVPAVLLENKIWRMLLLPEQKGRIAELIYKPTGRNLVNMPGAWFTHPDEPKAKVSWIIKDGLVAITRTLEDGSVWRRTVSLPSDTSRNILFQAEFTAGQLQTAWEAHERPMLYSVSGSGNPEVISVYTKGGRKWTLANGDWQFDREIIFQHLIKVEPGCVAYALYDYAQKFGIQQTFKAGDFQQFRLFWHPGRKEVGMDMFAPTISLKKRQKVSFSYTISYLEAPPMDVTGAVR